MRPLFRLTQGLDLVLALRLMTGGLIVILDEMAAPVLR